MLSKLVEVMSNSNNIFLSLLIPAYNEEHRISESLKRVIAYLDLQTYTSEIIVIDDGSKDQTAELVSHFPTVKLIKLSRNFGKGFAVKTGALAAKGKYVLFSDADLSTPIEEVGRFLPILVQGTDIVIGSRAMKESNIAIRQPLYRELMGKIFNLFVKLFLFGGFNDTQCGFKGFRTDQAKKIFEKTKIYRFSFDVEILYLAKKYNMKIKQLPITWRNNEASSVSPISDASKMFFDLLKIRFFHRYS